MDQIISLLNNSEITRQIYVMNVSSDIIKVIVYFILFFISLGLISRAAENWKELSEAPDKEKEKKRPQIQLIFALIFFIFVVYHVFSASWALLEWIHAPQYATLKHLIKLIK